MRPYALYLLIFATSETMVNILLVGNGDGLHPSAGIIHFSIKFFEDSGSDFLVVEVLRANAISLLRNDSRY